MSEREFENYLALLSGLLKLGTGQQKAIASELRAHLEDRLEELLAAGLPHDEAVKQALAEFGDAAHLATNFVQISRGNQRRWIMRATTFSMAASLLLAAAIITFWPGRNANPGIALVGAQQPEPAIAARAVVSQSSKVSEALNRRLDINFSEVPLGDVAQYLTEQTKVTFHLLQKKLDEASVPLDSPITSYFKDVRLGTWLELQLEEIDLTYTVRDDIVLITTPEHAESRLEIRVYDCRDLLTMPAPPGAEKLLPMRPTGLMSGGMFSIEDDPVVAGAMPGGTTRPASQATGMEGSQGTGGLGGSTGGLGGSTGGLGLGLTQDQDTGPRTEYDLRVETLINLITGNVDTDSWSEMGGPGTIHHYNGLIVITQTGQTHDKVERLLDMLRTAANLQGPGKVVR